MLLVDCKYKSFCLFKVKFAQNIHINCLLVAMLYRWIDLPLIQTWCMLTSLVLSFHESLLDRFHTCCVETRFKDSKIKRHARAVFEGEKKNTTTRYLGPPPPSDQFREPHRPIIELSRLVGIKSYRSFVC